MKKIFVILLTLFASIVFAFDGKQQPIKFLIPFGPGGGSDIVVRSYEKYFNELGYSVVMEYKPGADGLLGKKDFLDKNDLSGYTLLINGSTAQSFEDTFVTNKGWDINSFALVSDIAYIPAAFVSSKKSNITSFAQLKKDMKQGRRINVGAGAIQAKYNTLVVFSSFEYSPDQLAIASYKGAGPALTDVLGGHTDLSLLPVNMVTNYYHGDKLNILFVGSKERNKKLPNVPSISELVPGAAYVGYWGVVLPKGVSDNIVSFYVDLFKNITANPSFQAEMNSADMYISPADIGPTAMRRNYNSYVKQFQNIKW